MGDAYEEVIENGRRIQSIETEYQRLLIAGPGAGSKASTAMSDRLAAMAFHLAAVNIAASLDHLRTVAQVVSTGVVPAFALTSLQRTGHECALIAEWLMEPTIADEERVARGVGAQAADYDERRKFESAIQRLQPRGGQLARQRLETLLNEAGNRGLARPNRDGRLVPRAPLPSVIELFERFESAPPVSGGWLYRYYSGFAHGKQWAVTLGVTPAGPRDVNGHTPGVVTANDEAVAGLMTLATAAAQRAFTNYSSLHL